MYETHHFENRLDKLNKNIQLSQHKSQILEEELEKVKLHWAAYYDEAMKKLRSKIDDMMSQANIEHIEKLLMQLKEKDKVLGELTNGVRDL